MLPPTSTTWIDKSGNSRHADTKGGDPQFKAAVLNGKGVIDFDGGDLLNKAMMPRVCIMMLHSSQCLLFLDTLELIVNE